MKLLIATIFIFPAISLSAQEQKNFEGTITYLSSTTNNKINTYSELLVGSSTLKFSSYRETNGSKIRDSVHLMMDFAKKLTYLINPDRKTCLVDSMEIRDSVMRYFLKPTQERENILGYNAIKYTLVDSSEMDNPADRKHGIFFWFSDEVRFHTTLSNDRILFTANNNAIWLKMLLVIEMSSSPFNKENTSLDSFTTKAIKIHTGKIENSAFTTMPVFECIYKKNSGSFFKIEHITETEVTEDNFAPPPPPYPPEARKPKNNKGN